MLGGVLWRPLAGGCRGHGARQLAAGGAAGPRPARRRSGGADVGAAPALPADRCLPGGAVPCGADQDHHFVSYPAAGRGACRCAAAGDGPAVARAKGRRKAGLYGAGRQRCVHPDFMVAGHPPDPELRPGRPDRCPCAAGTAGGACRPLAAARHGVAAGAGGHAVLHQSGAQRLAGGALHRLAHRYPAGQPGRACTPVRDAAAAQPAELRRSAPLPRHLGAALLPGVRLGRGVPPGAAFVRLAGGHPAAAGAAAGDGAAAPGHPRRHH